MNERTRKRLASDIRHALADILAREVSDDRLKNVNITRVKLSGDGSHMTLFYETLGDAEEKKESDNAMRSARGFLRSQLASRIRMRTVPDISIVRDDSGEKGDRTLSILRDLSSD